MKYLVFFIVILALLISSCAPATRPPEPTSTSTYTPSPTATLTPTPTITPSPTPDPMQLVADDLRKEGINVDITTGRVTYKGKEIPDTTFDVTGLHVQIGENQMVVTKDQLQERLAVREGSVVVYDHAPNYDNPDMSQWGVVQAAWNPNVTEGQWAGWKERSEVISVDIDNPIIVGNSYNDFENFLLDQKAFLSPYTANARWPKVISTEYNTAPDFPLPFASFNIQNDSGGDNPFRDAVNYWIVKANNEKGLDSRIRFDVGGITEQVLDPNDRFNIQVLSFASGNESKTPINESYNVKHLREGNLYLYRYGDMLSNGCLLPAYLIGVPGFYSIPRMVPLADFYIAKGITDQNNKDTTGKLYSLVQQFMHTGKVPEELQGTWVSETQIWYASAK